MNLFKFLQLSTNLLTFFKTCCKFDLDSVIMENSCPSINSILIKNSAYRDLKVSQLSIVKQIYSNGEFCDVQFVKIEQQASFSAQIKNMKYALKRISKHKLSQKAQNYSREYGNMYNEITCLYLLDYHENVIRIFWHYEDEGCVYILMEYGGMKLLTYVKRNNLEEVEIKALFRQICNAVFECHSKNIMHRDLSLVNLVYNSQTQVCKLIDFGFTNQYTFGRTTALGTLSFMAPEVYHQKPYNHKADIWSLGIILYELIHKRNPFFDSNQSYTEDEFSLKRDRLQFFINQQIASINAKKIILKMLSIDPEKRPRIQEVIQSKWLSNQNNHQFQSEFSEEGNDDFSCFINLEDQNKNQNNKIKENADDRKTKQVIGVSKQKNNIGSSGSNNGKIPNQQDVINEQVLSYNQNQMQKMQKLSSKSDDYFNKLVSRLSVNSPVSELQSRLRELIQVHSREISQQKQLIRDLIQLQKSRIRSILNESEIKI